MKLPNESYVHVCMLLLHILLCVVTEKGKLLSSVMFFFTKMQFMCARNKLPFNSVSLLCLLVHKWKDKALVGESKSK